MIYRDLIAPRKRPALDDAARYAIHEAACRAMSVEPAPRRAAPAPHVERRSALDRLLRLLRV
jgi:hypothetical protein